MESRSSEPASAMELDDDHRLAFPSTEFTTAASGHGILNSLPLALYDRVGKYLDVGNNSDLTSLCIVVGREISTEIRRGHLIDNKEYLLHTIASGPETLRKAKILNWMEINPDWRNLARCTNEPTAAVHPSLRRVHVDPFEVEGFQFQKTKHGSIAFHSHTGTLDNLPNQGDPLLSVNGADVADMSLEEVYEVLGRIRRNTEYWAASERAPCLLFLNNADFIFNNPSSAIWAGLTPVLEEMVDNEIVHTNGRYLSARLPGLPKSLLHHSVSDSADDSCYKYLLSLEDNDVALRMDQFAMSDSVLHWCTRSSANFSLSLLEKLLKHPTAPNVNALNMENMTLLHHLCASESQPCKIRIAKVNLLLNNGADPIIADVRGDMPIDHLYRHASEEQLNEPEFEEMAGLILQGKRDLY